MYGFTLKNARLLVYQIFYLTIPRLSTLNTGHIRNYQICVYNFKIHHVQFFQQNLQGFHGKKPGITGIEGVSKEVSHPEDEDVIFNSQSHLWSNMANLSSAFRLSHKSFSLRGSRVIIGLIFLDFR